MKSKTDEIANEIFNAVKELERSVILEDTYRYSKHDVLCMTPEEIQRELDLQYYKGVENGVKMIQSILNKIGNEKEDS